MTDVAADPALAPEEKELIIRVNKGEDRITVYSEIPSTVRHLLNRTDFEKCDVRTVDGSIVAVRGTLPLGVLKIQRSEREYGSYSKIITEHEGDGGDVHE